MKGVVGYAIRGMAYWYLVAPIKILFGVDPRDVLARIWECVGGRGVTPRVTLRTTNLACAAVLGSIEIASLCGVAVPLALIILFFFITLGTSFLTLTRTSRLLRSPTGLHGGGLPSHESVIEAIESARVLAERLGRYDEQLSDLREKKMTTGATTGATTGVVQEIREVEERIKRQRDLVYENYKAVRDRQQRLMEGGR